jgi:hypothetical protein
MPSSYERTRSFPLHYVACRSKCAKHTKPPRRHKRYRGQSSPRCACGAYVRTSTTIPKVPILPPARAPATFGKLRAAARYTDYKKPLSCPDRVNEIAPALLATSVREQRKEVQKWV